MAKKKSRIEICHVSNAPADHDGYQVLVERVWPRGLNKEDIRLDHWLKDLAPSTTLRRWMQRNPQRWDEFRERYFAELRKDAAWTVLAKVVNDRPVLLLYSAGDQRYNHAIALKEFIEQQLAVGGESRLDIGQDEPTTGGNPPGKEGRRRPAVRSRTTKKASRASSARK